MNKTGIPFCDYTWDPIIGCEVISPGCLNCYAAGMAWRMAHNPAIGGLQAKYQAIVEVVGGKARFNGEVRFIENRVDEPRRLAKPATIMINSMSDIFHPGVTSLQIAKLFEVMESTPRHRYLVFTKRPERLLDLLPSLHRLNFDFLKLQNIHLIVTAENQREFDRRVPLLLGLPFAQKGLSIEPMLEAINPAPYVLPGMNRKQNGRLNIGRVIIGGESGSSARPTDIAAATDLAMLLRKLGLTVFFKQLGTRPYIPAKRAKFAAIYSRSVKHRGLGVHFPEGQPEVIQLIRPGNPGAWGDPEYFPQAVREMRVYK